MEWSIAGQPKWLEYYNATETDLASLKSFKAGLELRGHPVIIYKLEEV